MFAIILRRMLWLPVLLLAISAVVFLFGTYGPGDPARVRLGNKATEESVARVREELGLNRPIYEQYLSYVGNAIQGDFGELYKYQGVPVTDLLAPRIWVSIQLAFVATLLVFCLGVPLGVMAAVYQGRWVDRALIAFLTIPIAIPIFVMIPIVQFIFVRQLHWFASAGWDGIFSTKAILPLFVMCIGGLAGTARMTRTLTLDVMHSDYVRTARAKGLRDRTVLGQHVLRNSLLPLWTSVAFIIAELPAGALLIEGIFGIPGVGQLAWDSIFQRDYPVIQAIVLLGAFTYVIGNLIVDIGYPFIDPRIRSGG